MEETVVQPGLFASEYDLHQTAERSDSSNKYATAAGYSHALRRAVDLFGVTLFQLGRLLGLPEPGHVYKWTSESQRTQRRPASKYMLRLCVLFDLHMRGVSLVMIDGIDWTTGQGFSNESKAVELDNCKARYVPKARRPDDSDSN